MHKLLNSFKYAFSGIWYAVRTQRNMKIHVTVALLVILLGAIVSLTWLEWCLVILLICAVTSLELVNTAIESAIDRFSTEPHSLAKVAKDTAAGAVLVMSIGAAIIGIMIFAPKLMEWLR